jgi:hypothetical protein
MAGPEPKDPDYDEMQYSAEPDFISRVFGVSDEELQASAEQTRQQNPAKEEAPAAPKEPEPKR